MFPKSPLRDQRPYLRCILFSILLFHISVYPSSRAETAGQEEMKVSVALYDSLFRSYRTTPTTALQSAFSLMEMPRTALPDTVWANTPLVVSSILVEQGLIVQALDFLSLAIHRKMEIGHKYETGYLYLDIGNIYFARQQFDKARDMYLKAIEIFREVPYGNGIYTSLNNLGLIELQEEDLREALSFFRQAAAVIEEYNLEAHIFAFSFRLIRDVYAELGQLDSSRFFTEQVLEIMGPRDEFHNRGQIQQLKGEMLLADGDTGKALQYFADAENEFRSPLNVYFLLELYQKWIAVLLEIGEPDQMMHLIESSDRIASENNYLKYQIYNALTLNDYFQISGRTVEQLQISLQLNDLYQRADHNNNELQNHRLQVQSLLDEFLNRMDVQENTLRRERMMRNTIMLSGMFLLTVISLLVFRYRQTKNMRQLLLQQEVKLHEQALQLQRTQASELKRDLVWKSTQLLEMNSFLDLFQEKLNRYLKQKGSIDKKDSLALIREIQSKMKQEHRWEQFETEFIKTNPGFFQRLDELCPDLTPRERKICAYHKMQLDTKDIAELTSTSVRTVQNHRYRIRTKCALPEEISFQTFIDKI